MTEYTGGSLEADHLCVLVHGVRCENKKKKNHLWLHVAHNRLGRLANRDTSQLWGNPNHMASVAKTIRAQYPPEKVYLLVAERNSGSFTYDGIECGGERVCLEIEEELESIKRRGGNIKKISIVGYSLGGLVARYAIGLLHARGVLDNLECMVCADIDHNNCRG